MTPEAAVGRLVALMAARPIFNEDDLYAGLAAAGLPDAIAEKAYKFTQIAWGRLYLKPYGVTFDPDYWCFNAAGEVMESGQLVDQPYYIAALAAANVSPEPVGFDRFALMAAETNAVKNAIKAGSKPTDLVTGPAAIFLEPPTVEGIEKARQAMYDRATRGLT